MDDANELLKSITTRKHWGFIDNTNINADHLMPDGVHLDSVGVRILAKNIITHIAGPSECAYRPSPSHDVTPQRTPFGDILFSEALKKPVAAARDNSTGFRISITRAPSRYDINHAAQRFEEQLNRTTIGADTSKRSEHCAYAQRILNRRHYTQPNQMWFFVCSP